MQPHPHTVITLRRWLVACMTLVAAMVLIGGLTRLTESGLSIVKWELVSGTLPPMNAAQWAQEFSNYQATPQYKLVNHDFCLDDFRQIFWLEYLHRLIGRLVGLVIFLPFLYFALRRQLNRAMLIRGLQMTILVGLQGTVGWVMVASGLHDEPRVAPLKLALHLSLAFSLFLLMLWTYWQLIPSTRRGEYRRGAEASPDVLNNSVSASGAPTPSTRKNDGHPSFFRARSLPLKGRGLRVAARALFTLIFAQIVLGALVAGLRAGLSYNTYPLMDGQFIPDGLWTLNPWWRNHLESILTVQFQHRMGALIVVLAALTCTLTSWRATSPEIKSALKWLLGAVALQFSLGVATLLSGVNIALASAHQLGALLLLSTALNLVYCLSYRRQ